MSSRPDPPSIVWKFFKKCDDDRSFVECKCGKKRLKINGGTGGMIRHVRDKHSDEMKEIEARKKAGVPRQAIRRLDATQAEIDDTLIRALCTSNVPFRFLKNKSFMSFCKLMNPNYNMLSPDRLRRRLSTTAEEYVYRVKHELKNVDKFFLSFDGFDGKYDFSSLYAVYLYAVDKEFKIQKHFLGIRQLTGLATHQAVGNLVTDLLQVYNLSINSVLGAVTDAGSNLGAFLRRNYIFHVHCAAHSIALILKGVTELPMIKSIVSKVNSLAAHLSRSKPERAKFRRNSAALNIKGRIPLPFCVTRWGGFVMLAESYMLHYQSISALTRFQDFLMSEEEKETLEEFLQFTRPFLEAVSQAERDGSFSSEILVSYATLYDFILKQNGRKHVVRFLSKATFDRYNGYMDNDANLLAVFCDPRFAYLEGVLLHMEWEDVERTAESYCDSYTLIQPDGTENGIDSSTSNALSNAPQSHFRTFIASKRTSSSSNTTKSEIVAYRALVDSGRPSLDSSPINFWEIHQNKFQKLSLLARHFLASPQSSAQVERLFSRCSQIVASSRRNRLSHTTLNELLLCSFLAESKREVGKQGNEDEDSGDSSNEENEPEDNESVSMTHSEAASLRRSTSAPELNIDIAFEEATEDGGISTEELEC